MENQIKVQVGDFVDRYGEIFVVEKIEDTDKKYSTATCSKLMDKSRYTFPTVQLMRLSKDEVSVQLEREVSEAKKKIERIDQVKELFGL